MPQFSKLSLSRLATCHKDLQILFSEVIRQVDIVILEGYRDEAAQEKAFSLGNTKLHWPHGKHNSFPSNAVDVSPYPVDFGDSKRFYYVAGITLAIAKNLLQQGKITHAIRWGGNWDRSAIIDNEGGLVDLPHFEIML